MSIKISELKAMIKEDYPNMDIETTIKLKSKGGKLNKYLSDDINEIPAISNIRFGSTTNKYGINKNSVRSALTSMAYQLTDGEKEEITYREGHMLKNVDLLQVTDHENGMVTVTMFSEKLDYSVEIILHDDANRTLLGGGYKRGTVVG